MLLGQFSFARGHLATEQDDHARAFGDGWFPAGSECDPGHSSEPFRSNQ